jgi:hypothetical protein
MQRDDAGRGHTVVPLDRLGGGPAAVQDIGQVGRYLELTE